MELRRIAPDAFKNPVNCFIGLLGKKYRKKCRSFVCGTAATAAAAYLKGHMENEDVTFTNIDGLLIVSHKSKERLPSDNTPLHRQVICNGIKSTLQMIEKVLCTWYLTSVGC